MTTASPKQISFVKRLEAQIGVEGPEPETSEEASERIEELLATVPHVEGAYMKLWRLARDHQGPYALLVGKRPPWGKTSMLIDTMQDLRPTAAMLTRLNDLREQLELPKITLTNTGKLYEAERELRIRLRSREAGDYLAELNAETADGDADVRNDAPAYTDEDSQPESDSTSVRTRRRRS